MENIPILYILLILLQEPQFQKYFPWGKKKVSFWHFILISYMTGQDFQGQKDPESLLNQHQRELQNNTL